MLRAARHVTLAIAALAPFALVAVSVAHPKPADRVNPSGTVAITPATGGSQRGSILALAGSPDTLVYDRYLPGNSDGDQLFARSATGASTDLGAPPEADSYSVVGQSVTGGESAAPRTVVWWNLGNGHSGTVTLPSGDTYLTGAPTGFVYADGDAIELKNTSDDSVTSLGTAVPGAADYATAAGADGFVVSSGAVTKYQAWADPGVYSTLDSNGLALRCEAVVGAYAGCAVPATEGEAAPVPLDGSAPVTLSTGSDTGLVAVAGSTLIVLPGVPSGENGVLTSRSYSSATVSTSSMRYRVTSLVSALGKAVVATPDESTMQTVTSAAATPATLQTVRFGGPVATSFSLSPGQVVYNDDERNSAVPPGTSSTLRTPVSTDAAALTVGTTSTVQAGDVGTVTSPTTQPDPTTPLASGTTTAFPTEGHSVDYADRGRILVESLTVTGPHRQRTIGHIIIAQPNSTEQWLPTLSGNRLSYLAQTGTGTPAFFVYDVAKDTTTRIMDLDVRNYFLPVPAVAGNYVAYVRLDGSIWRRNLVTGTTTEVAGKVSQLESASVFAAGDYVAWTRLTVINIEGDDQEYSGYRNVVTGAHVYLGTAIVTDVSDAGLVLTDQAYGGGTYTFESFDGHELPITRLADTVTIGPLPLGTVQVDGRAASWIYDNGVLEAAPLDITAPAPRMEGDTLAPQPANPAEVAWHPYVPYSEPLTSCSVAVMNATATVATLACNRAELAVGVADVVWNGRIGSHHAPAGTYHYEITASGEGGAALDSDGHALPVAGHFTIG